MLANRPVWDKPFVNRRSSHSDDYTGRRPASPPTSQRGDGPFGSDTPGMRGPSTPPLVAKNWVSNCHFFALAMHPLFWTENGYQIQESSLWHWWRGTLSVLPPHSSQKSALQLRIGITTAASRKRRANPPSELGIKIDFLRAHT